MKDGTTVTSNKDDAAVQIAGLIHQDTDPELL